MTTLNITPGDPGGIGPEVLFTALSARGLSKREAALCVLPRAARAWLPWTRLSHAVRTEHVDLPCHSPTPGEMPAPSPGVLTFAWTTLPVEDDFRLGAPTLAGARAAWQAFTVGVDLCLAGKADAIMTGPIAKRSIALVGGQKTGHTEHLAERAGVPVRMLFVAGTRRVMLQTIHCALSQVAKNLSVDGICQSLSIFQRALSADFAIERPSLAVLALNPHAGEGGLFGEEDERLLSPAIALARAQGIDARGPFPADGFFGRSGLSADFDGILAMYHDQGLIPVKISGVPAVNVTLGLPFVRTSVDHGTAFDLAGTGKADPSGARAALDLAFELARRRSA